MFLEEIGKDEQLASNFAEDLITDFNTLLFIDKNKIRGTISWNYKGGIEDGVVELVSLGVKSNYHRKGIASKLVNCLIDESVKHFSENGYHLRVIFLYMDKNNEVGRLFYEDIDFQKVCSIPSFYPNGDAIIWIRYFNK